MTKREKFMEVIKVLNECNETTLADFIQEQIDLIDNKAKKAKENAAIKKDNDELTKTIVEFLTDEFQTVAEIVSKIDNEEATSAKVVYRLNKLAKENKIEKTTIQIEKRKVVAFKNKNQD